ncbi:MAG: PilZ domain-containing protein [Thermoguttaceae bacterium]|nr:PilZ domain-containing protein [Thermoguttaceae bacterium]MDW8037445.1 PilZ domain-containing protein [Thermoguttaceae bacterium]
MSDELALLLARSPCLVRLPPNWSDFFEKRGLTQGVMTERRQFPRIHLRSRAVLQYQQSFPTLPRPPFCYTVYTKDISRSGVAFLHGEQLYPCEQMILILPDGKPRKIEVVRCHRIATNCFEIGARFAANRIAAEHPAAS